MADANYLSEYFRPDSFTIKLFDEIKSISSGGKKALESLMCDKDIEDWKEKSKLEVVEKRNLIDRTLIDISRIILSESPHFRDILIPGKSDTMMLADGRFYNPNPNTLRQSRSIVPVKLGPDPFNRMAYFDAKGTWDTAISESEFLRTITQNYDAVLNSRYSHYDMTATRFFHLSSEMASIDDTLLIPIISFVHKGVSEKVLFSEPTILGYERFMAYFRPFLTSRLKNNPIDKTIYRILGDKLDNSKSDKLRDWGGLKAVLNFEEDAYDFLSFFTKWYSMKEKKGETGREYKIHSYDIKDRYAEPTDTGFMGLKLLVRFEDSLGNLIPLEIQAMGAKEHHNHEINEDHPAYRGNYIKDRYGKKTEQISPRTRADNRILECIDHSFGEMITTFNLHERKVVSRR